MSKREVHIQKKIDAQVNEAKGHLAKKTPQARKAAMICMKRKKMYEKRLEQIMGAKMTLETQRLALESMNINQAALEAQREGARAMQQATKQMGGVDAVEETMDQVEEGLQDADEIGQAMSRSINTGIDQDDDELLAELTRSRADAAHALAEKAELGRELQQQKKLQRRARAEKLALREVATALEAKAASKGGE